MDAADNQKSPLVKVCELWPRRSCGLSSAVLLHVLTRRVKVALDVALTHAGLLAEMERGLVEVDHLIHRLERGENRPGALRAWRELPERMLAITKEAINQGHLPKISV